MPSTGKPAGEDRDRLVAVTLDEASLNNPLPDIEHERQVAIYDLLEANHFCVVGRAAGPYRLRRAIAENRLVFDITGRDEGRCAVFGLSLTPFRRLVKDYFLVCESYFQAIRAATPSQIEAIDVGRRGLHDEGSQLLRDRLDGKVELDSNTSRRLFTLLCVLHWRG